MTRKITLIVRNFDDTLMARIKLEAKARRITVNQFWIQVLEARLTPLRKSLKPMAGIKRLGYQPRIQRARSAAGQSSLTS
jgi:hypothetical protein